MNLNENDDDYREEEWVDEEDEDFAPIDYDGED